MVTINTQSQLHENIWEWLRTSESIRYLYTIASGYDENNSLQTDSDRVIFKPIHTGVSTIVERHLGDNYVMQYDFMLSQYQTFTIQPNTKQNIDILQIFDNLAQWVFDQQNKRYKALKMPDKCQLIDIVVNPGMLVGRDEKGAEYQMIINLKYYKLGGK